jgi:molybdopterin/thiamine biosynthesis adenylyltransferase
VRPRLKPYLRQAVGDEIVFTPDAGVAITLPDPAGQVTALLELLDGRRTMDEVALALAGQWAELTRGDIVGAVTALDEAGLLEDAAAPSELTAWQAERYSSNLAFFSTFASLGRSRDSFQASLRRSRVVLLGVGGLGSTVLFNLAGTGVGHVTLVDFDKVELKNLARQFLYSQADIGQPKVARAVRRARSLNSELELTAVERQVTGPGDVAPLLPGADLVVAAIDQPPGQAQDWVNEACVQAGVPFIGGGFQASRGLFYSVRPDVSGCLACYRVRRDREREGCSVPDRPKTTNRGIGPVATLIGSLIALEVLRYLSGFAEPISAGKLWLVDFATGQTALGDEWERLPDCQVCGRLGAVPSLSASGVGPGQGYD